MLGDGLGSRLVVVDAFVAYAMSVDGWRGEEGSGYLQYSAFHSAAMSFASTLRRLTKRRRSCWWRFSVHVGAMVLRWVREVVGVWLVNLGEREWVWAPVKMSKFGRGWEREGKAR